MKTTKKATRKDKEESFVRGIKKEPKPQWAEQYGYHDFNLTDTQNELRNKILENDLVICEGVAGSGKSAATLYTFVKEYVRDNTKKIVVVRTPVEVGSDQIGFLVGDLDDKTAVHFESTKVLLNQLLNKGKVETDTGHRIKFIIPNYLLGTTLDNTLLLVDECFTEKHELLTKAGWKNVKDITEEDFVCQYTKEGNAEFVKPSRVIHKSYQGNIVEFNKADVSYSVTENHRVIYSNHKGITEKLATDPVPTSWQMITAGEYNQEMEYPLTDEQICLAVAMQADGSTQSTAGGTNWQITISKQRKIDRFLLLDSGTNYFHEVKGRVEKGSTGAKRRFYSGNFSSPLLDGKDKNFVLDELLKLSLRQRKLFIQELAYWDGSFYRKGSSNFIYCTTNKHNTDVVQALCSLSGFTTVNTVSIDNRKESYKDYYRMTIKNTTIAPSMQLHPENKKVVPFTGNVHCVTVDSGMVLTRCNNRVHVSGNCQMLQPLILKLILERIGIGSKVVLLGDSSQLYSSSKDRNALRDVIPRFFYEDDGEMVAKYPYCAYHKFEVDDVQRSEFVKNVIRAYST